MSDGTWSLLLSLPFTRPRLSHAPCLSLRPSLPSLPPARACERSMKAALSIINHYRLDRPGIDNVWSTKPALGSTERCCRFNRAGLLRNDRPPLLRFHQSLLLFPVPVPAFSMQVPCYLCAGLLLPFCCLISNPPATNLVYPSPIPRQLISQQLPSPPPQPGPRRSGRYDSHPSVVYCREVPTTTTLLRHQQQATVPIEAAA